MVKREERLFDEDWRCCVAIVLEAENYWCMVYGTIGWTDFVSYCWFEAARDRVWLHLAIIHNNTEVNHGTALYTSLTCV